MLLAGSGQPAHGWLMVNPAATIVAADVAACAMLGIPAAAELIGHAWTSLLAPTEQSPLKK